MGLFDPINWQGWPQFGTLSQEFYEDNPNSAYQRLLGQMGLIGSQSNFGKYATGQRDDAYQTYLARLGQMAENPNSMGNPQQYGYVDFLKEWGPHLSSSFRDLSPEQRGERFPGGVPRSRWIGWSS